jgi:pyruvate formate lyase activating enzyme
MKGLVYNIQRYCIHDGSGIRTTIFFKGCDLYCPWCANPESQKAEKEKGYISSKCTGCNRCLTACANQAIKVPGQTQRELCDFCEKCSYYCLNEAYINYGKTYTVEELVNEVDKDSLLYRNSGGGVTVSGGEPMCQLPFLVSFLKACKEKGYHTAIETHGSYPWFMTSQLLGFVDEYLIDIKHMDEKQCLEATGCDVNLVLENIRKLAWEKQMIYIRVPIIPDYNDSIKNMEAIASFAQATYIQEIHLLPYHTMGISKYDSLGRNYPVKIKEPPTSEKMEELLMVFRSHGIPAQIGG